LRAGSGQRGIDFAREQTVPVLLGKERTESRAVEKNSDWVEKSDRLIEKLKAAL
jgi:hypothetical protein